MPFKFQKLEIRQAAIEMPDDIDKLPKTFPKEEIFVLTSQLKKAAESISLNTSEASTAQSNAEQSAFLVYGRRSALEVVNCLFLAKKRGFMPEEKFTILYDILEKEVTKTLKIQSIKINKTIFRSSIVCRPSSSQT